MTIALTQDLKRFDKLIKLSDAEGSDLNYERALSNLAHIYVQDRAPSLLKYEIGFQLIERSEDNSKAVGILGFKIGRIILYVPIFYIRGKIYGTDMVYVYNSRRFLPLNEASVQRFLRAQASAAKEPIDAISNARQLAYPNLMQLKPNTLKWAEMQPDWLKPFIFEYVSSKVNPKIKFKDSKVIELLSKSASSLNYLVNFLDQYPKWANEFYLAYGDPLLTLIKSGDSKVVPIYPEALRPRRFIEPKIPDLKRTDEPADVEIFVYIHDDAKHKLPPSDLERLRRQGYLVRDGRKKHTLIRTKPAPAICNLINDSYPGFTHLLMSDMSVVCAYVVPITTLAIGDSALTYKPPVQRVPKKLLIVPIYQMDENGNVLRRFSGRKGIILDSKRVVAVGSPKDEKEHDFSMFENAATYGKTDVAVAIFTRYESTEVLRIKRKNARSHLGHIVFETTTGRVILDPNEKKLRRQRVFHESRVSDSPTDQNYLAPTDAKIVEIVDNLIECCAPANKSDKDNKDSKDNPPISFMDIDSAIRVAIKHADAELRVAKDANGYILDHKRLGFYDALKSLVIDYGLKEADALSVLKTADAGVERNYLVKFAIQPFPKTPPAISAPVGTPQPLMGRLGNIPVTTLTTGYSTVDTGDKGIVPNPIEPLLPTPLVDRLLSNAMQTGQKEVFDTSVFTALASAADPDEIVTEYLPDLYDGLNAIGKLRMNVFMHYDRFEERYGKEDTETLVNAMKNTFHNIGDIIARLEEKPENLRPIADRIIAGAE